MNCNNLNSVYNIHEQTNKRIYERNIPSSVLQPYIDIRPVMTKYSYMPIVDPRKENNVQLLQTPTFNANKVFNPGNTQSPWSGFASNINLESELKNQVYALQKCNQSVYVPNSNSDLYHYSFIPKVEFNPHVLLFEDNKFNDFNPNHHSDTVGVNIFNNNTRVQTRDLTKNIN
jgi:hypothetical protein